MLGNPEKITTSIPSNANQWPQIFDDHKIFMASSSSASKPTEKTNQDPHQQPLKCPRCDSSNTKFCYYNNYSLSQPRHFCKACKRYWTRGGTLRNVPVGGGCRKNKRAKRHPSNSIPAATPAIGNPSVRQPIDLSPASNHITNPLFFSLPANSLELNLPFSGLSSTRVSSLNAGFELQPQMNGPGIGFSSSALGDYKNGFRQIHDTSSSPFFSAAGNHSVFFGSSNSASTSTMASLLASSLQQQKLSPSGLKDNSGPSLMHYGDTQMPGRNEVMGKLVKMEGEYRSVGNPNQMEQINSSDPSSLLWNTTNVGTWFDPSNMGSSVPSLI